MRVGIVLLFILIKQPSDLLLYIFIMCGTTFLETITMWFYVPKFVSKVEFKKLDIFHHFRHTIIYFIPTIATTIYTNIDKTLIGLITKNMKESAYYEQITKILELAKSITFVSLNSLLTSRMSYLFAEKKFDEMKEKMKISMNYILFLGIGISFGIIGVSNRFVPLFFGNGYDKVILLLKVFIFIVIVNGISNCLETQYYTPAGRRKESTKFIVIGTVINIILNIVFIPFLSSLGAIISSIIAEIVIATLYLKNCNNFINIKYILSSSMKKIISGSIMLLVIFFINNIISHNIIAIILEIGIGGLTYLVCLTVMQDKFVLYIYKTVFSYIKNKIKPLKSNNV